MSDEQNTHLSLHHFRAYWPPQGIGPETLLPRSPRQGCTRMGVGNPTLLPGNSGNSPTAEGATVMVVLLTQDAQYEAVHNVSRRAGRRTLTRPTMSGWSFNKRAHGSRNWTGA